MSRIDIKRPMRYEPSRVWEVLSDLERQTTWMKDAEEITFVSDQRRGTGTKMEVLTVVGPLRTNDIIEVTDWVEGSHIDVVHIGLVKGTGRLAVTTADDGGTIVRWTEETRFPWWLGGPITGFVAKPILRSIWKANLARLEAAVSGP